MFNADKDPNARLDYTLDWSSILGEDTIVSSSWTTQGEGAPSIDTHTYGPQRTTVWLSGGGLGNVYNFVNRITTSGGRTDDRTLQIFVIER